GCRGWGRGCRWRGRPRVRHGGWRIGSAEEVLQQARPGLAELVLLRHLALRGELIDELREQHGEHRRALLRRHAGLLRHLGHPIAAEYLLERVRIDGLVLAGADPGVEDGAEPVLLEPLRETLEAADPRVVQHGDDRLHEAGDLALIHLARIDLAGIHLALTEHTGEELLEKSHVCLPRKVASSPPLVS